MRHRKPKKYRGQHRAPALAPRTRYGIVVGSALVGAGVIAFAGGTALPQPPADAKSAAMEMPSPGGEGGHDKQQADERQNEEVARASRGETREAAPTPEKQPLWLKPAEGYISSGYGYRPEFHGGTDIAAPTGATVVAASDGVVKVAGWYGGYGNAVIIEHANGVSTLYGHNSQVIVSVGDHVKAGDLISRVGNTGNSFGPHLHFEVRIGDERIDPMPFMRDRGVVLG